MRQLAEPKYGRYQLWQLTVRGAHIFVNVVTHVTMMASCTIPSSTTSAGLLTAGEVSSRYVEMRRRVNLFIPTSACLFRAMGDLCASAVMGPGGQLWLPESERSQVQAAVCNDQGLGNNVLHSFILNQDYRTGAIEHIASFAQRQVAEAKVRWLHDIENALLTEGHSNAVNVISDICTNQKLLLTQLQALELH